MNKENPIEDLFGEVIHTYTRAEAIEDGALVDVSEMAREAGFRWPVAMTRAAWEDCVAWTDTDSDRQTYQDESGRLWDVLYMAQNAIRASGAGRCRIPFHLYRVPRDGKSVDARLAELQLVAGPGDFGEPVLTLLLPGED
ncbi:MAG TPA: hypothetical protein ENK54_08630 [Thiotrichales bacterium]|nr:hypothetical protein [Thiotrichales bacterium]